MDIELKPNRTKKYKTKQNKTKQSNTKQDITLKQAKTKVKIHNKWKIIL